MKVTRPPRPLADLLFRNLVAIYLLLALGISTVQLAWRAQEARAQLLNTLESLTDTFSPGLTNAIWVMEDTLMASFTNGLKNDPVVASVVLTDPKGQVLFAWDAGPQRPPAPDLTVTHLLNWKLSNGEERPMGKLVLASSDADWQRSLVGDFGQTVAVLLGLLLGVLLLLWFFLRGQVVVPLRSFSLQVDELLRTPEQGRIVLQGQGIAEIESLRKNFNTLLEGLLARQLEVERHNSHLEQRVSERTQDLERAKLLAEEASRAKGQFLANMSHEIRTPMNAILGFTHLVETSGLTAQQADYVAKIHHSADTLLGIINDILDFSKIDAGKLDLVLSDFHLADLVTRTLDQVRLEAERKHVALSWSSDERLPPYLKGDPLRVGQVLSNLLTNAVKFTSEGSIQLSVETAALTPDKVVCRFVVTDTGIGLTEVQKSRLFQPFTQADDSITRQYGGTGLGLVISRRLVELMGGTLDVRSEVGRGSEFWFTAEFGIGRAPQGTSVRRLELDPRRGGRILLVEDNPLNQLLARELLRRHGLDVTVAENGKVALERVAEASFDLIFMDQHMPLMDGLEATRRLRSDPALARLPIVAMTANVLPQSREDCLTAGMNDFLTKPLVWDELYRVLNRWLPLGQEPATEQIELRTPEVPVNDLRYPELDLPDLLDRLMNDRDLLREVLETYLDNLTGGVGSVAKALEAGNPGEATTACHAVKGVAANLSLTELHPAAVALEAALKEGRTEQVASLLARALEAEARARARIQVILG